ncbi:MAG: hypothetical protein ACK521_04450 [bacterium]
MENEELILTKTYLNSQAGPLVDFNQPPMPSEAQKKDRLVWRDFKNSQLTEENRDEDDLINLVKPAKQLNHYTKPSHALKSKLKTSKLF